MVIVSAVVAIANARSGNSIRATSADGSRNPPKLGSAEPNDCRRKNALAVTTAVSAGSPGGGDGAHDAAITASIATTTVGVGLVITLRKAVQLFT